MTDDAALGHALRVRVVVRGRVQGVGFRYAAVAEARRLGLAGWARNTPDGNVEILADGPSTAVREFITWCRQGPPMARVSGLQQSEESRDEPLGEFGVKW